MVINSTMVRMGFSTLVMISAETPCARIFSISEVAVRARSCAFGFALKLKAV